MSKVLDLEFEELPHVEIRLEDENPRHSPTMTLLGENGGRAWYEVGTNSTRLTR
jgi:hypothetical protein